MSTAVDNRMYGSGGGIGTCKNIKDTGITIYTIQVNTGGDPKSTLLKNCASTGKFVMLTTASQIITTFQQIGTVALATAHRQVIGVARQPKTKARPIGRAFSCAFGSWPRYFAGATLAIMPSSGL